MPEREAFREEELVQTMIFSKVLRGQLVYANVHSLCNRCHGRMVRKSKYAPHPIA
jgi:hypothetical protein